MVMSSNNDEERAFEVAFKTTKAVESYVNAL